MGKREQDTDFNWWLLLSAAAAGTVLIFGSVQWAPALQAISLPLESPDQHTLPLRPFAELLKLVIAALIAIIVTAVHKHYHRDKPLTRSLQQSQVLLCVAGAMVMIIIGNSLARAFGLAGAAGIVRFRTPVEDPKDTTLLFLLVALGMSCGIGQLEVAGLGTVFLCALLAALDHIGEAKGRSMILSVVAAGKDFPEEHVHRILRASVDFFEVREVLHGSDATVKYSVNLPASAPLSWLSQQLMGEGNAGIKGVSWQEGGKK